MLDGSVDTDPVGISPRLWVGCEQQSGATCGVTHMHGHTQGSHGYAPRLGLTGKSRGWASCSPTRRPVGVAATPCRFLCWQVVSPTARVRLDSWLASNSHLTREPVGSDSPVVVVLKLDRMRARTANTVRAKPLYERLL